MGSRHLRNSLVEPKLGVARKGLESEYMPDPSSTARPAWIPIARLMRPQGRKGEILAELLTDLDPAEQFHSGRPISLAAPNATEPTSAPVAIESHWLPTGKNAGRIVLKLAGCDSISQAELLANQQLLIPAADLPTLDPDTFYVSDLIGCTLIDAAAPTGPTPVGTIVDVQFAMSPDGKTRLPEAAPLLGLHPPNAPADADPILIPFVRAHLISVDLPTKQITMNIPSGLLDPEAPTGK